MDKIKQKDEIEKEIRGLDSQIWKITQSNSNTIQDVF